MRGSEGYYSCSSLKKEILSLRTNITFSIERNYVKLIWRLSGFHIKKGKGGLDRVGVKNSMFYSFDDGINDNYTCTNWLLLSKKRTKGIPH